MVMIFPLNPGKVSWATTIKQDWEVTKFVAASGSRKALVQQTLPRWTLGIKFPALTKYEVNQLMAFYARCKGSWHPFYYKDYERFEVLGKVLESNAEGVYQGVIPIEGYEEPAELIDNVVVFVDGKRTKDFTVDGGTIRVNAPSATVKFDYEYYFKVAFSESLSITQIVENVYTLELKLEVVR